MIGFVESRLTMLTQSLESELKIFDGILLDSHSPYHAILSSVVVIALPLTDESIENYRDAIARAFSLFEWRLQTSGDISDWKSHHNSNYALCKFDHLPPIVLQDYTTLFN